MTRKRISERLAEMLTAALQPDRALVASDFWIQQGAYRHKTWDLARWGAWVRVKGATRSVCSWDTMTACVRKGISVSNEGHYSEYEVSVAVAPPVVSPQTPVYERIEDQSQTLERVEPGAVAQALGAEAAWVRVTGDEKEQALTPQSQREGDHLSGHGIQTAADAFPRSGR